MHRFSLALACLTFTGCVLALPSQRNPDASRVVHAKAVNVDPRFQSDREVRAGGAFHSLDVLSTMLLALRPSEAFNAAGLFSGNRRLGHHEQGVLDFKRPRHAQSEFIGLERHSPVTLQSVFGEDDKPSEPDPSEKGEIPAFMRADIESEFGYETVDRYQDWNGTVALAKEGGAILIQSKYMYEEFMGREVKFSNGGSGIIVRAFDYSNPLTFVAFGTEGDLPSKGDLVTMGTLANGTGWDGDAKSWSGVFDHLGRPVDSTADASIDEPIVPIFQRVYEANRRKVIQDRLHTGISAVDVLVQMGRGQSLMIMGPDDLPKGSTRQDLYQRILAGQTLDTGVRTLLLLNDPDESKQEAAIAALKESGAYENTRVIKSGSLVEALIAFQLACSTAQARDGEDFLVVVDSYKPVVEFWNLIEDGIEDLDIELPPGQSRDATRAFYAMFCERAHRRKGNSSQPGAEKGGSVSIVVVVESASQKTGASSATYTLQDFLDEDFPDKTTSRIEFLEQSGIVITDEVLKKLGIAAPGAGHLGFGEGMAWQMEVDQLISLVDAHIELRQTRRNVGMVPPVDPGNSLTRVGLGTAAEQRGDNQTKGVKQMSRGLRQLLCFDSDPTRGDKPTPRTSNYKAVLHQPDPRPLSVGEELLLLNAADNELLTEQILAAGDSFDPQGLGDLVPRILEYARSKDATLLSEVSEKGKLDSKSQEQFTKLVKEAVATAS